MSFKTLYPKPDMIKTHLRNIFIAASLESIQTA